VPNYQDYWIIGSWIKGMLLHIHIICYHTHISVLFSILTFKQPTFTYMNAHKNTPLEIHVIYLGNKKIYCTFKTRYIIPVLLSTKCHLFHNFIFFCSLKMFFINVVLKFKYQPSCLKVNCNHQDLWIIWGTRIHLTGALIRNGLLCNCRNMQGPEMSNRL
jgi:hypothetical protein